jgi:hypothetical protein
MDQWYALVKGQQYGPVDFQTLSQWTQNGQVNPLDLVWREGMDDWAPASSISGLEFGPSAPPSGAASARGRASRYTAPHRGGSILALGILGLAVCGICGIVAWSMGNQDLRDIDAGRMDPSGRGMVQAGRICGMIATIWMIVAFGFGCIWFAVVAMAGASGF